MKRFMSVAAFVVVLLLGSALRNNVSAQYRGDVSYQTFYDELSPYGQWVDYPQHGYVWVPDAGRDFRPYSTNGHWVWSDDYEWMWVSDYDWGWAPFHYGRWLEDDFYGWVWVPGYEWSPAWVAWRDGGDYYGWAPLRPGINISINFNLGSYSPPYSYWSFVPRRHITSHNVFNFCMDRRRNVTIINQTVIINNYNYSRNVFRTGPRRANVEIYTGRINPVRFRDSYNPGRTTFRNNEVSVYRPQVRHDNNRQFAPRQFQRYEERNNDNRNGRNDNNFRRNDNGGNRENNANTRTNNLPSRRENDRNDNTVRDQQQNNNNNDRRFDRTERNDNNAPSNRNNEQRVFRSTERQNRNANQGNNENQRVIERKNDNTPQPGGNNQRRVFRSNERQDRNSNPGNTDNQRVFERRNENNTDRRQPEARTNERQERQQPQRVEQKRQEQPRQIERRTEGNSNKSGERNNGGGNNRNRRF